MAELDDEDKYITDEQPWWANDYLIFLLTIANIAIIVYDLEYFSERNIFDIIQDKDLKWMFLASSDLLLICIFLADLKDDYDRCVDKEWWWTIVVFTNSTFTILLVTQHMGRYFYLSSILFTFFLYIVSLYHYFTC